MLVLRAEAEDVAAVCLHCMEICLSLRMHSGEHRWGIINQWKRAEGASVQYGKSNTNTQQSDNKVKL